jgi:hypothetical protein
VSVSFSYIISIRANKDKNIIFNKHPVSTLLLYPNNGVSLYLNDPAGEKSIIRWEIRWAINLSSIYTRRGVVLCIARQGIHSNRKNQQACFIARRAFIAIEKTNKRVLLPVGHS